MKKVIAFLRTLRENNNTEWFHAHRREYEEAKDSFSQFARRLIEETGRFDESVAGLELKDCTYRINRDIRFSADKSPYKTHFGVFIAPGGKKSGRAGYYFHLSVGGDGYPDANMVAIGHYCYDKRVVEIVREDLMDEPEKFASFVRTGEKDGFSLDDEGSLKKLPKEFSECKYPDYARLKVYCLSKFMSEEEVSDQEELLQHVLTLFRHNKPFVEYLNQVIDYVSEED